MIKKVVLGVGLFLLLAFGGLNLYFFLSAKSAFQEAKVESSALVLGNPRGGLLVVSFVDYQCPHCPTLDRVLEKTLLEDQDVKVLVRPVLWMGKTSEEIASLVLAARKQGKAALLHKRIMEEPTPPSFAKAKDLAVEVGVDVKKAEEDAKANNLSSLVQKNSTIAVDIGLRSVPSLIIGSRPYAPPPEGMPGVNALRLLFEDARARRVEKP